MKKLFLLKMVGDISRKIKTRLTQNIRWGWLCQLSPIKKLDGAGMKKASELNILGGTGMKKLFLLKMLVEVVIEKARLT